MSHYCPCTCIDGWLYCRCHSGRDRRADKWDTEAYRHQHRRKLRVVKPEPIVQPPHPFR